MKKFLTVLVFCVFVLGLNAQDAKEIIRKMDDKLQGNSNESVMQMAIVRPKYTRTIEFKNWSLGRDYFMTIVTAPAKDKGQVFMKFKNEIWSYNPSINRMIKLPPSMMSQGWMGSDYTNDDLVKQSSMVDDYRHTIVGEETIEGRLCYIIEMIPNDNANVVWGKVKVYVDKVLYISMKSEYFDEEEYLVRTELGKDVKTFDGRELPSIIEIIPAEEPDNKTIITIKSMDFDVDVKGSFFSQQNMKRIR
ncbi:MAG: outer membrane lipoprotein-sorting protein [Salinivirgaceae bacterium]|jgi:outer membrane lipoprotein-sorting protein|nr:outer membrane lipoprotein-sorting protein [Salinivirgaceae bacterium]